MDVPIIAKFLQLTAIDDGSKQTCHTFLYRFCRSLGKNIAPAASLLPFITWPDVDLFLNESNNEAQLGFTLDKYSPVMSLMLSYCMLYPREDPIHQIVLAVFRFCLQTARNSFPPLPKQLITPLESIPVGNRPRQFATAKEELMCTGAFYPHFRYHSVVEQLKLQTERACNKLAKTTGRLGAGCLVFWCGRHRLCIGWEVLLEQETPKSVWNALASRFPKAPKVVIYDNACNLYDYVHNRTPNEFIETIFLSDPFHWAHHINCSHSFNAKYYRSLLRDIVTIIHEQKNSRLANLKITAPSMRYDSFTVLVTCVLGKIHFINDRVVELT